MQKIATEHLLPTACLQLAIRWLALLLTLTFPSLGAYGADGVDESFERDVADLFINRCISCHGAGDPAGGLDLTSQKGVAVGGDSGAVLSPRDPENSRLIERLREGEMPPEGKGERPTDDEMKRLAAWITSGAKWPKDRVLHPFEKTTNLRGGYDWWSLQPIATVRVPQTTHPRARNPIDHFVFATLAKRGLKPSDDADRRTILRRLKFDLVGLPATPEEIETFVNDNSPKAYEDLVDRLLASRHYGERWARYWLDIVHYADTHGFERDQRRDNAWHFRDYVIDSLNSNKPYDRFLREQIAGDIIYPSDPQAVIATGYLAAGPFDFTGQKETKSPLLRKQARADDLDDMVTTVITSTMGLTINCARCHDHKIDPISQEDYYRLWAVFSGVRRDDRPTLSAAMLAGLSKRESGLLAQLGKVQGELARSEGKVVSLADIVGGGSGFGEGTKGHGINPQNGKPTSAGAATLANPKLDHFVAAENPLVDGVFMPSGTKPLTISSTGMTISDLPKTSGAVWDYIANGPSKSHQSTKIGDVDYNADDHFLLGIHANKGITFDLAAIRRATKYGRLQLRALTGYGGAKGSFRADLRVCVDGVKKFEQVGLSAETQGQEITIDLLPDDRFLTLVATDGGNGYSHDQVYLADPRLVSIDQRFTGTKLSKERLAALLAQKKLLLEELENLPSAGSVYAAVPQKPVPVHLLTRGDVQRPKQQVAPGALSCLTTLSSDLAAQDAPEGKRRAALARWITDPENPLTPRVIVNRLWHYHFGTGIVATPSDFGFYGDRPSHPELLDWLAKELVNNGWSLKHVHRLIVTSATYRQASTWNAQAAKVDAENRLLWRYSPQRLDAEATRDTILAVAGNLNLQAGGPGFWEFKYKEEYAPVYTYVTPTKPEQWRRSVYRFVVRTSRNPFMKVLDCPNPAILTPVRNRTTTAAQSLTLLNNRFMLQQAKIFAGRLEEERPDDVPGQIELCYWLAFGRSPTGDELAASQQLVDDEGLFYLCRVLLAANEFVYLD